MTNSTDYDNRPLDEVERLRQAQVEALKRRIEELESMLSGWPYVLGVADTNHESEAKERP